MTEISIDPSSFCDVTYPLCSIGRQTVVLDDGVPTINVNIGINETFSAAPWPHEDHNDDWGLNLRHALMTKDLKTLSGAVKKAMHYRQRDAVSASMSEEKIQRRTIEECAVSQIGIQAMVRKSRCASLVLENPDPSLLHRCNEVGVTNCDIELVRGKNETDFDWTFYTTKLVDILQTLQWKSAIKIVGIDNPYKSSTFYYCGFHPPRRKIRPAHFCFFERNIATHMYNGKKTFQYKDEGMRTTYVTPARRKKQGSIVEQYTWDQSDGDIRYHFDLLQAVFKRNQRFHSWGFYNICTTAFGLIPRKLLLTRSGVVADSHMLTQPVDLKSTGIYLKDTNTRVVDKYGLLCGGDWKPVSTMSGNYFSATLVKSTYYHSIQVPPKRYCVVPTNSASVHVRNRKKNLLSLGSLGDFYRVPYSDCTYVIEKTKDDYKVLFIKLPKVYPYLDNVKDFALGAESTDFTSILSSVTNSDFVTQLSLPWD